MVEEIGEVRVGHVVEDCVGDNEDLEMDAVQNGEAVKVMLIGGDVVPMYVAVFWTYWS